jgi:acyl carrier protein
LTRDEVIVRIEPIVRDLFDQYDGPVSALLRAKDVEQWDSLSNVQLTVMVEKTFGVRLSSSELGTIRDLGGLADMVLKKQHSGSPQR